MDEKELIVYSFETERVENDTTDVDLFVGYAGTHNTAPANIDAHYTDGYIATEVLLGLSQEQEQKPTDEPEPVAVEVPENNEPEQETKTPKKMNKKTTITNCKGGEDCFAAKVEAFLTSRLFVNILFAIVVLTYVHRASKN